MVQRMDMVMAKNEFVDLHNHILFGMDDGAQSINDSLYMLNQAITQGISQLVLTPHYNPITDDYDAFISLRNKNMAYLREVIEDERLPLNLKVGAEVYFSTELLNRDLSELCIENTDYLLIELPTHSMPNNLLQHLYTLIQSGYRIVLAHIERYPYLKEDSELLVELIKQGVLMQVNGNSFLSKTHKNFIKSAIKHDLIHLVASDAHNNKDRTLNTRQALDAISKDYGEDVASRFNHNAQCVFENKVPDLMMPTKMKYRFGRFF